jgi:Tfp pilus assembly protein PilV
MGVMLRIADRRTCPQGGRRASESGFLLVEVMVSAVVLLLLAMATLSIIDRAGRQASGDRSRSVASSLAQADQDRLRALKPAALYSYGSLSSTKTVSGITYKITSEVDLTRDSAGVGSTLCTAAGATKADYFRLVSTITWPSMGVIKPVQLATILSPGVTDPTRGALTVKLTNEAGYGVQGATVTAAPAVSAVTNSNGCVYFSNLTPGTYNVAWSKFGYVDRGGNPIGGKSATVAANANASLADSYDLAATIPVAFKGADTGATSAATTWPTFTIASGSFSKPVTPAGSPYQVINLYPYSAGYSVFAGSCTGNEPSQTVAGYFGLIPGTDGSVVAAPGATTAALGAYLRRVVIPVTVAGSSVTTFNYKIKPDGTVPAMTGCETAAKAAPQAAAGIDTYVPYGQYTVCADAVIGGATWSTTQTLDTRPKSTWAGTAAPPSSPASIAVKSSAPSVKASC